MTPVNRFALICLILCFLVGCKKNQGPAPAPPILDSFRINLNFPQSHIVQTTSPDLYELIISEGGGRVVLDTVLPYNTPLVTWLKTNQKLLDITTVMGATANYTVHAYKGIDLTGWINMPDNDSMQLPTGLPVLPPPVTGLMTYTHVNVPLGSYYNVLAGGTGVSGQDYGYYGTLLYGSYNASPGDYTYLIFPELGWYNIHRITSARDTVDFSVPGIATRVPLTKPAFYQRIGFSLAGYADSNDLSHTVNLTYFTGAGTPVPDITEVVYPGKGGFQKYSFSYYVSADANLTFASVNLPYIDAIPANLPIPDPSWYTTTLKSDTGVQANFTSHAPTYYDVTSHIGYTQFRMTAPGDTTLLYPVAFYRRLKSKLLAGVNLSAMQFDNISIVTDAEPDYNAYWAKHSLITPIWTKPPSANTLFQRHF